MIYKLSRARVATETTALLALGYNQYIDPACGYCPPFSVDSPTIMWSEAEHHNVIAVKECLCPFSPSLAYNSTVYTPPPEYVNNSEVMQGIVWTVPVSGSEKLSPRRRRIFNFLTPSLPTLFTKQYT